MYAYGIVYMYAWKYIGRCIGAVQPSHKTVERIGHVKAFRTEIVKSVREYGTYNQIYGHAYNEKTHQLYKITLGSEDKVYGTSCDIHKP